MWARALSSTSGRHPISVARAVARGPRVSFPAALDMQTAVEVGTDARLPLPPPPVEQPEPVMAAKLEGKVEKQNLTWMQLTKSLCAGGIAGAV